MRKIIGLIVFVAFLKSNAQNNDNVATVENKVIGVQVGLFGAWAHYEKKLTPLIALRTEIGIELGLRQNAFTNDDLEFILAPSIVIVPRWYYSFKRRIKKSRPINNNSGSFLALKTQYFPDWFVISSGDNISVIESLEIIPKIGYRKVWKNNISFEGGFGIGKSLSINSDVWDTTAELTFRIGYNF